MPSTRTGTSGRLTHRAVVLGLVLLVLVISYASSMRAWLDQRQEIAAVEQQIAQTHRQVADLEQEKRRWADEAYVQQQARARLGYLLPGETGYRVIGSDGKSIGAVREPVEAADSGSAPAWFATLWDSSQRAGRAQ